MVKSQLPVKRCIILFGRDDAGSAERAKCTEIKAGVEVNLDEASGDMTDSSRVVLEKAAAVGRKMGLSVVGCCWDSGLPENSSLAPEAEPMRRPVGVGDRPHRVSGSEGAQPSPVSSSSDLRPEDVRIALSLFSASRTNAEIAQRPFVLLLW